MNGISFTVGSGEILGVAGVMGNGQTALAEALTGLVRVVAGDATLDGISLAWTGETAPQTDTVAYIPERPIDNAVVADLDLAVNLDLRNLARQDFFPRDSDRNARAAALLSRYDVRPPNPLLSARALSGGNLQKLVVARELSRTPQLVVACYPTMGLDVSAAARCGAICSSMPRVALPCCGFPRTSTTSSPTLTASRCCTADAAPASWRARAATRDLLGRMMTGIASETLAA